MAMNVLVLKNRVSFSECSFLIRTWTIFIRSVRMTSPFRTIRAFAGRQIRR